MRVAMLLHKSVEFDSRVRREAAALARAGHEVTVLELAPVPVPASVPAGTRQDGGAARSTRLDGFERRSVVPAAWMRRRLPFHLYRAAFLGSFVNGIRRVRPEIVHAHDAAMLLPGLIGARLTGARLVYDSHELATSVPYRERAWAMFVEAIERLAVPRCAAVITVSDGIAQRLRERYHLPVTPCVVRNVSALSVGEEASEHRDPHERPSGQAGLRTRLGITPDTPLVLHQGAPAPARGCEVLIEAVATLPGVQLAFLGDPEPGYGAVLSTLIDKLSLHSRVKLLPSVPLEDLLAHTAEADVGVTLLQDTCLNHRLALPNKLFEYIAAEVPVVAAALGETQRLVESYGVGWCARPDDPAAVAGVLRVALHGPRDPGLRERLQRAAQELCWEREQLRLVALYERLSGVGMQQASAAGAHEHKAVAAQNGHPCERPVPAPGAPGQRWQQSDRLRVQLTVQPLAQIAQANQAGVGVGGPNAGLPDRNGSVGSKHALHLQQSPPDLLAPADGG
jgi:glycosyltransferase involved in cell wall biosynthesis